MIPAFVKRPTGETIISPLKRYVKTGIMVPPATVTPLVIAANGISPPIIVDAPQDATYDILYLQGEHDAGVNADVQARMACTITDYSWRRQAMNREILVNHVFGTAQNPFFLKESIFLRPQQVLQFNFFNRSAAGNTGFRFAATGKKVQNSVFAHSDLKKYMARSYKRKTFLQPFWNTTDAAVQIAASARANAFMTNTRDRFIVFYYVIASAITTGVAGDVQEFFTFRIFDAKTDRPMMNVPATLNTGAGNASFPYLLPEPIMFEPLTQLRIEFSNLVTDQPTEIFFTLHGVACYTGKGLWSEAQPGVPPLNAG